MLDESQAEIKIARKNIDNLRYADDTTLTGEIEEEPKSLLLKVKEESEKAVFNLTLNLKFKKTKIMAFSTITSYQIEREKVKTMADFIFLGSKILWTVTSATKLKDAFFLGGKLWPT